MKYEIWNENELNNLNQTYQTTEKGGNTPLGNIVIAKITAVRASDDPKDTKKSTFQIDTADRIFFLQGLEKFWTKKKRCFIDHCVCFLF